MIDIQVLRKRLAGKAKQRMLAMMAPTSPSIRLSLGLARQVHRPIEDDDGDGHRREYDCKPDDGVEIDYGSGQPDPNSISNRGA
jgi:hypothetical protein